MIKIYGFLSVAIMLTACAVVEPSDSPDEGAQIIAIDASIEQVYQTRAGDDGFAEGDEIGVFVVDRPGELALNGNRADNLRFTFDEGSNKWIPDRDLYYKDSSTGVDVYGYYPYGAPDSIEKYGFEVKTDQSGDGYESSDLLWARSIDNDPSSRRIILRFKHIMAGARITLIEGSGFKQNEWATLEKSVITQSAIRSSIVNLRTGTVTVTGNKPSVGTIAMRQGDDYRCIIVPQTIAAGDALFSVTVGGLSYSLRKGDDFTFVPSKLHNFTITVNKRTDTGEYELILSGESISAWENDPISHDGVAREYVIVNVPGPGTLEERIAASGKDQTKIKNIKLTGTLGEEDFIAMRERMPLLRAVNLKEARVPDDKLPDFAFAGKTLLTRIILPDILTEIGVESFSMCHNLTGSLTIPEGVVRIGRNAFEQCKMMTGTLTLPTTLKVIEDSGFYLTGFTCELHLPESLEEIGNNAFGNCSNFYGELHLPSHLKKLGANAFGDSSPFDGPLVIPQTITEIPESVFGTPNFPAGKAGYLKLHDGITSIGEGAFRNRYYRGELILPKGLSVISNTSFAYCDFSGTLVIPEDVATIGSLAFAGNWRLSGTLRIPGNVQSIGEMAFLDCRSLETLILEDGIETIGSNAFAGCFGIGRIICRSAVPPVLQSGAFDGVPKDNFTLEVPESAIATYSTEPGWCEFKRISAYRNFVIRPSLASAINTPVTRQLILNADDEWLVESCPQWVSLDKTSGSGKTAIALSFNRLPKGSDSREGEVVFKMKNKEYRTRCKVAQYDYEYEEDEFIPLQVADKGRGVNIVILGDGFSAKDVSEGKLLESASEAYSHFFDIEPFKSYKDYFNVYTAVSVSPESGIGNVNSIVYTKFNTSTSGGGIKNGEEDFQAIADYACRCLTVSADNLGETLVIMIPNSKDYGGVTYLYPSGFAISYCPMSDYDYPLDFRGVIQHEAGGHGFGKLGDEYIYHNAFIDACGCTCCGHDISSFKSLGWFRNLSSSGKPSEVDWKHLIYHPKYQNIVDIFEGGYMHTRNVYRSEQNSCMNNEIPYYNTISRQAIVERIMAIAGEPFDFEMFVEKDVIVGNEWLETKAPNSMYKPLSGMHHAPVLIENK